MPTLFDPLAYLATLDAYAKVSIDADGDRYITLEFKRGISSKVQLQAKAISKRYGRLLLMQLDVPMGRLWVGSSRRWNRKSRPFLSGSPIDCLRRRVSLN